MNHCLQLLDDGRLRILTFGSWFVGGGQDRGDLDGSQVEHPVRCPVSQVFPQPPLTLCMLLTCELVMYVI